MTIVCNDYIAFGSRTQTEILSPDGVLPLIFRRRSAGLACLAYQAYKDTARRHLFPAFLQEATDIYKRDLESEDVADLSILFTAMSICSISVRERLFYYP